MTPMDHEEAQSLLGAYALGAMPPEEIAQIRAHILSCEQCMREADALAEASGSFGISAGTVPLPMGFSERVLRVVREERAPREEPAPSRRSPRLFVFAGAAAVVIAIVAVTALISARADLGQRDRLLAAVLQDEGVELDGEGRASGKVIGLDGGSVLVATGLSEADPDDYVLWFIRDGEPSNMGAFDIREGLGIIESESSIADYDAAAVTIEQDADVDRPSGAVVLST